MAGKLLSYNEMKGVLNSVRDRMVVLDYCKDTIPEEKQLFYLRDIAGQLGYIVKCLEKRIHPEHNFDDVVADKMRKICLSMVMLSPMPPVASKSNTG